MRSCRDGWSAAGFDDSRWAPVALADHGYANLGELAGSAARGGEELAPVAVRRVASGQVFDLGQNINGWVRLRRR